MQFARGPAAKGFGTAMASYLAEGALYRRQCAVRSLYGSRCTLTVSAVINLCNLINTIMISDPPYSCAAITSY